MIYMGIDVGVKGGISFINQTGSKAVSFPMPDTEIGLPTMIRSIALSSDLKIEDIPSSFRAVIEQVHAMPKQGVTSMFTFGQNYGFLRGVLCAMGIPFEEVSPMRWQRFFGLSKPPMPECENKDKDKIKAALTRAFKKTIFERASNMYPQSSVALQSADSLMLAEYLRRTYGR